MSATGGSESWKKGETLLRLLTLVKGNSQDAAVTCIACFSSFKRRTYASYRFHHFFKVVYSTSVSVCSCVPEVVCVFRLDPSLS